MDKAGDADVRPVVKTERAVSIRFPATVWDMLRIVAERDKRSLNSEVVWIVEQYIEQWLTLKERDNG